LIFPAPALLPASFDSPLPTVDRDDRGVYVHALGAALLLLLVLPAVVHAQTISRFVAPSGLTVIVAERHATPVVTVQALVRSGPVYEEQLLGTGVSALAQRIQVHHAPTEVRSMTRRTGSQFEYRTEVAGSTYRLQTTTAHVDDAIRALALLLRGTEVSEAALQRERERLLLEQDRLLIDPDHLARLLVDGTVYQQHPARLPVLGRRDALLALQQSDVHRYLVRRYTAPNVVVVVVGNVDTTRIRAVVRSAFAYFPEGSYNRSVVPEEPPQYGPRQRSETARVPRQRVHLAFRTVPLQHGDQTALAALASALDAPGSRLRQVLENEQLVERLAVHNVASVGRPGYFEISYQVRSEQANRALAAINEVLGELRGESYNWEAALVAAVRRLRHGYLARNGAQIAEDLCRWELALSQPDWGDDLPERLAQVDASALRRVMVQYLQRQRLTRVLLTPEQNDPSDVSQVPVPPALSTVPPRRKTFDNGLRLVVQNIDTGIAAVVLSLGGGPSVEQEHQRGASAMLAELLVAKLQQDIGQQPERANMRVAAEVAADAIHIWVTCFAEEVPLALSRLTACVREPAIAADGVALLRQQMHTQLARDPQYLPWDERLAARLRGALLEGHWAGREALGTKASLVNLDHEILRQFLGELLQGGNLAVAVVGGPSDQAAIQASLEQGLGDPVLIPSGEVKRPSALAAIPDKPTFIDLSGLQPESAIAFGWSLPVSDVQRADFQVLAALLGGASGRDGRLGAALAEVADGGVQRLQLTTKSYPGRSLIHLFVLVPQAHMEAVRKCVDQQVQTLLIELRAADAAENWAGELAAAQSACLTQAGLIHEDPTQAARLYTGSILRHDSLEAIFSYREHVAAVDRARLLPLLDPGLLQPLAEVRLSHRVVEAAPASEEEVRSIIDQAKAEKTVVTGAGNDESQP